MAISVVMPALEMAQETGKLISWLKKEGESVAKGEPLLEIETDKAVMEIESPGRRHPRRHQGSGRGRSAGWPNHRLDRRVPEKFLRRMKSPSPSGRKSRDHGSQPAAASAHLRLSASCARNPQAVKISPKARRLASERGIDSRRCPRIGRGRRNSCFRHSRGHCIQSFTARRPQVGTKVARGSPISRLMAERTTAELDDRSAFLRRPRG